MSIQDAFVRRFGAEQASRIGNAAIEHRNGINDENMGSDPFKWALLIAISYQCMEVEEYREGHGITVPWEKLKAWIKKNADLGSHDGDCDYLALIAGIYNEYVKETE